MITNDPTFYLAALEQALKNSKATLEVCARDSICYCETKTPGVCECNEEDHSRVKMKSMQSGSNCKYFIEMETEFSLGLNCRDRKHTDQTETSIMDVHPSGFTLQVYPFQIDWKGKLQSYPAKEFILHDVHASKDHHQLHITFDYMSMSDRLEKEEIETHKKTF